MGVSFVGGILMHAPARAGGFSDTAQPWPCRMPSIIYPPTIDWHYLYQRPQQLMAALARLGYRVFFCNSEVGRRARSKLTQLSANLYLVSGSHPGPQAGADPILWVSYPPHAHMVPDYRAGLVVFDAVDEPAEEFAHSDRVVRRIAGHPVLVVLVDGDDRLGLRCCGHA